MSPKTLEKNKPSFKNNVSRGNALNIKMSKLRKTTVIIVMMLFTIMLFASVLQQTTALPTIATINPDSGPVGTSVRVTGTIDTTNGSYQILWDEEIVKEGTCVNTMEVNDTFTVPLSATGNHNVTLYDANATAQSSPALFTVTTSYYVLADPIRIQEGINTSISVSVNGAEANATYTVTINVTNPQPTLQSYTRTLTVSTSVTGSGSNSTLYPGDFPSGANTNYVGTYTVTVLANNKTLTTCDFTVGLTDKLEYKRQEIVSTRGSGFNANENVTVSVTFAGTPAAGYPKNVTANTDGIISDSWQIPINATIGTYTVRLTNATTPGTVKTPTDTQNFTVIATTLAVTIPDGPQTQYKRTETALLKFNITYPNGALYNTTHLETITISIYYNTTSVANVSLTDANYEPATGKWNCTWRIPKDAVLGTGYNFTILKDVIVDKFGNRGPSANIFSTTFRVSQASFTSRIKTVNLAGEALVDVVVEVYKATANQSISTKKTNATGWATFQLELGNYTFKAFWKNVEVGVLLNQSIEMNTTLTLECRLANIEITVRDETNKPLPFIDITLMYNYTTRNNQTITETRSVQTDLTGTAKLFNLFVNMNLNYTLEARRYDLPFNTTLIERLPASPWLNVTITAPTYTALVHVTDAKNTSAEGVKVSAFEWSSGTANPVQSPTTDQYGNATFSLTFGKYIIRVYKENVLLNETTINLIQDNQPVIIYCSIYNADLKVVVIDYFGQPIPNALVIVERRVDSQYVETTHDSTKPDGVVSFNGMIGGDSRISAFVAGKLAEVQSIYIASSKEVTLKINGYVVVAGYALETSQIATMIILIAIIVIFILALTYKGIGRVFTKRKKA